VSKLFLPNAIAVFALIYPVAALADLTGTPTLSANSTLNLDTGAVGSGSSGDILWTGSGITPQGTATAADLGNLGAAGFSSTTQATLASAQAMGGFSASPITSPPVGEVLGVLTNFGSLSKILVTATSGTSATLQFDTFNGSPTTSNGPVISALQNNYSGIPAGFPNYGIAPGSLFVIYGTGLSDPVAPVLQSLSVPLPLTLNHTSISVTVNGVTTQPAIYYTSATQVAGVLPSTTPTGSGTITVTYNGTAGSSAPILVTTSAFGLDTLSGTGSGEIVATDASGNVIQLTASASPGQTIILWGSGLGADTANDDRTFPNKLDNLNDATVYIGGVQATVAYAGRSQYPGVDQINVVVPSLGAVPAFQTVNLQDRAVAAHASSGLQSGCFLWVAVGTGGKVSNIVTLPVNPGGGDCLDPITGLNGTQIAQMSTQGIVHAGTINLVETTQPSVAAGSLSSLADQTFTTSYAAEASFQSEPAATFLESLGSYSSCSYKLTLSGGSSSTGVSTGVDAGPILLTGGGLSVQLPETATGVGSYFQQLASPLLGGSTYTFTGDGAKGDDANIVGPFTTHVTFPAPFSWISESSYTTISESQPLEILWSGGDPLGYVQIIGRASTPPLGSGPQGSAYFTCVVPGSDNTYTVPSYLLSVLPTGGVGELGVFNLSAPVHFLANDGLAGTVSGTLLASVQFIEYVTYKP
jgi:uncharacterized protein (TIGR03437 family)